MCMHDMPYQLEAIRMKSVPLKNRISEIFNVLISLETTNIRLIGIE